MDQNEKSNKDSNLNWGLILLGRETKLPSGYQVDEDN